MAIGCNIWMICLKLNWYFYGLSRMFQLPQFVWGLRSSVWDVFINFLLIDATDRSKISGDQKRLFIALSLYPLSFFANTPFKIQFFLPSRQDSRFDLKSDSRVLEFYREASKCRLEILTPASTSDPLIYSK